MPHRSSLPGELAELVGQQTRRAVAALRDPRAKALRRRRRARRAAVFHGGIALLAGTITTMVGSSPALEFGEVAAGSVTVVAGLAAVFAAGRWVRLSRTPLPAAQQPPAMLPPPGSAAREPLIRLAAAQASLVELLAVLERRRSGVAVVAPEALDATREAVSAAAAQLHGTAEAICAVERAVAGVAGSGTHSNLLEGVATLRRQLDAGVDEVCGLVTATGAVVAAAGPEYQPAALAEATDRLTGLAEGLRELTHRTG